MTVIGAAISKLSQNVPPHGLGVYARAQSVEWLSRFDWIAINARRADAEAKARELISGNKRVWFYSTPEWWKPHNYAAEITRMTGLVGRLGAKGFICDPESDWQGQGVDVGRSFGRSLESWSSSMNVGVTSYPQFRAEILQGFKETVRGKVWGSPQIYGRTSLDHATFASWWRRWTDVWGDGMVIPSVAGWASTPAIADSNGYLDYLAGIPTAQGAIAWTTNTTGGFSFDFVNTLRGWFDARSAARGGAAILGFLQTTAGKVALAVVVALIVILAIVLYKRYR